MKYILLALMALFLTSQAVMANGGPSVEQIYKSINQGKPVVELIDKASKNERKQICLINHGKNKVKDKIC
ncbi:MAG: hypothetical protein ACRBDX_05215 [Gammaproteobacteria bacterium]